MPDPRVIDQDGWDQVKARMGASWQPDHAAVDPAGFGIGAAGYLFTGLMRCGSVMAARDLEPPVHGVCERPQQGDLRQQAHYVGRPPGAVLEDCSTACWTLT